MCKDFINLIICDINITIILTLYILFSHSFNINKMLFNYFKYDSSSNITEICIFKMFLKTFVRQTVTR